MDTFSAVGLQLVTHTLHCEAQEWTFDLRLGWAARHSIGRAEKLLVLGYLYALPFLLNELKKP